MTYLARCLNCHHERRTGSTPGPCPECGGTRHEPRAVVGLLESDPVRDAYLQGAINWRNLAVHHEIHGKTGAAVVSLRNALDRSNRAEAYGLSASIRRQLAALQRARTAAAPRNDHD